MPSKKTVGKSKKPKDRETEFSASTIPRVTPHFIQWVEALGMHKEKPPIAFSKKFVRLPVVKNFLRDQPVAGAFVIAIQERSRKGYAIGRRMALKKFEGQDVSSEMREIEV